MRVTMLSKALVVGAYQRKCELIARHGDIDLTVLVPPSWRTGNHMTALERAHICGYTLRVLPIRFNGNFHLHYYPTLRQELALARPDVVHIDEEPYNLATYLALKTARSVGAKTIVFSWQNLRRDYPPPFRWFENDVLAHADAAIAGNSEAASVLRAKGFGRAAAVIPQFGVDEDVFRTSESAAHLGGERHFTVGYVGRLVKEKGVDLLLHASSGLPQSTRVIITGTGPELNNLRDLAMRLNMTNRIEFTSVVPSVQMPSIYARLDALVLPSRTQPNWKEQFGRALIEAMACGVPVVGSRCGEIPNVIGEAGLLFDEGDSESLRECLMRLFEQPALRAELAERGRARVLAHYTMSRIADQTVTVYRGL